MKIASLFTNKKVWNSTIAVVLLLACFIPIQSAFASTGDIIGVDGRIIPATRTGDNSAWVEIAQHEGYALIIRQDPLTSVTSMYRTDNKLDNTYAFSTVRTEINNWYNNKLSSTARLRSFAVTNNAMNHIGSYGAAYVDGISRPLGVAAPNGVDVAFALSFCEAVYFCSTQYHYMNGSSTLLFSPQLAFNNYHKLRPAYAGGGQGDNPTQAYWLRTPGISYLYAGAVAFQGGAPKEHGLPYTHAEACGRVNQHTVIGTYAHYRPAMWVGNGIFGETVTYEPNGGIGTRNVVPVASNSNYTIVDQGYLPANSNLAFDSWNTMANGTGTRYTNGQTIYITASITLYAQWKTVTTPPLTVTYNPNGGIGNIVIDPVPANTNYTIRNVGYTHSNPQLEFDSWNTRADGLGIRYTNGQVIYLTSSLTLYAQWKTITTPPAYVIYNPNGGIGNIVIDPVPANSIYTIRDVGYTHANATFIFDGWNTRADGLGVNYSVGQPIYLTSTLTLYAKWKIVSSPILLVIYDPNGGIGNMNIFQVPAYTYYTIQDQGYQHSNPANYRFNGWNTMPDGSGTSYNNGNTVYMTNHLILYAMWQFVW